MNVLDIPITGLMLRVNPDALNSLPPPAEPAAPATTGTQPAASGTGDTEPANTTATPPAQNTGTGSTDDENTAPGTPGAQGLTGSPPALTAGS